jgi:hypothetical protein
VTGTRRPELAPRAAGRDRPRSALVFILGTGRSGSTLLSMILGAHTDVFGPGETILFDRWTRTNDRCSCALPVRSCPVWSQVLDRMAARRGIGVAGLAEDFPTELGEAFDRSRVLEGAAHLLSIGGVRLLPRGLWTRLRELRWFAELRRRTENALELYDCLSEASGGRTLVDSSKSVYRTLHVYTRRAEAVRVIFLTRDGRGTVNSLMKHHGFSAERAARRWRIGNAYTRWMIARMPLTQRIHVRYEALCVEPERTVRDVCAFMGLEYEPAMLNFRAAAHHMIAGSPMRFGGRAEIGEDSSWRREMSAVALRTFERIGGRLNRRLLGSYYKA